MSKNLVRDIQDWNTVNGNDDFIIQRLQNDNIDLINEFIDFRMGLLTEEYVETRQAHIAKDPEEFVDGLIDLMVIAMGTLELLDVDVNKAWDAVLIANMSKKCGVKKGRPNPLGLPDMLKPKCWVAPDHSDNHGLLDFVWDE